MGKAKAKTPRIKMMFSRSIKECYEVEQYERKDGSWQEDLCDLCKVSLGPQWLSLKE